MWIDNSLDFLLSLVHHVVCRGEVTLFKSVLGCSMADKEVLWLSALVEINGFLVILVLFLSLHESNKDKYFLL